MKDTEEDVADYTCGVGGERVKSWSGKEKTFKKSIQHESCLLVCQVMNMEGKNYSSR